MRRRFEKKPFTWLLICRLTLSFCWPTSCWLISSVVAGFVVGWVVFNHFERAALSSFSSWLNAATVFVVVVIAHILLAIWEEEVVWLLCTECTARLLGVRLYSGDKRNFILRKITCTPSVGRIELFDGCMNRLQYMGECNVLSVDTTVHRNVDATVHRN